MNRLCRYVGLGVFLCANPLLSAAASDDSGAAEQRIIVKWKDDGRSDTQTLSTIRRRFRSSRGIDLQQVHSFGSRRAVLRPGSKLSNAELSDALENLNAQSEVEYALLDQRRRAHAVTPNDPYFAASNGGTGQWYLQASEPAALNAVEAWGVTQGSNSVVAVLDTGVRFDHPDLSGKLLAGQDFVSGESASSFLTANDGDGWDDDASDTGDWVSAGDLRQATFRECEQSDSSWHGTRVSGLIGAATNNGIGIAGTGWNTAILPVRVLGKCGGWDSDILAGMRWAAGLAVNGVAANAQPAKVINLSLGATGECTQAYQDVIDELWDAGVIVVASAGNDGGPVNAPANCEHVVAVAGLRHEGDKVGYSSLGREVTIAAPAGNCVNLSGACLYSIDTTYNTGTTTPAANSYTDQTHYNLGTSFSAPLVSGVIALMYSANVYLTPERAVSSLTLSATVFPTVASTTCHEPVSDADIQDTQCNCTAAVCGAGMLNAYGAVKAAMDVYTVGGAVSGLSGTGLVLQNNGGDDLAIAANGAFTFANKIAGGGTYLVTVKTQPSNPTQTCSIANASGTVANADIANVAVTCTTVAAVSSVSGGGSGGGGGLGLWELFVTGLLLSLAREERRRHKRSFPCFSSYRRNARQMCRIFTAVSVSLEEGVRRQQPKKIGL